jgi:uncharacterized membrane protein
VDPVDRELTPPLAERNINTIAQLEAGFRQERSCAERMADSIASFVGSIPFVLLHLAAFLLWILWNTGHLPWLSIFDPFPFILLSLVVSCEGVLLSTFVLMKQNRMTRGSDRRDHLNLQVDILAEQEITKVLQTLRVLCRHLGVREPREDPATAELSQETAIEKIAAQVDEKIPGE